MNGWLARAVQPFLLTLVPLLVWQGKRLRTRIPRLPEAHGPQGEIPGEPAKGSTVRIAVLGDSTAAGVGVASHEEALAGHLGLAVAEATGRPVSWRAVGRSGATARSVRAELVPALVTGDWSPDTVVIALGVNDLKAMRLLRPFEADLRALVEAVRATAGTASVILCGMPPVGQIPGLPQPMRAVMGVRAQAMDHGIRRVATRMGAQYATCAAEMPEERAFATDRFHPGPEAYRIWGRSLAPVAAR